MSQPYDEHWSTLEECVHRGPGELTPEQRRGAWRPQDAPGFARDLVEKLHGRAAEIDDADVAALGDAGWSDDQVFEFLVSGAVAAGRHTVDAGLAALVAGGE